MNASSYRKTCRSCLGSGCVWCNNNGTIRERVFRRVDTEAQRLRALITGQPALIPIRVNNDEARRALLS